jgi:DNA-binding NarL/FixJ family response regulator
MRPVVPVLVVDDQVSYRRAAASMIVLVAGFALAGEAASGEEAIAFLEQRRVGLILMDVNMPGMGGVQTARVLRDRYPQVQVILLSTYVNEGLTAAAADMGATYRTKERFGPEDLSALLDHPGDGSGR